MNLYVLNNLAEYLSPNFEPFRLSDHLIQIYTQSGQSFIARTTSLQYTQQCVIPEYYMYPENYMFCFKFPRANQVGIESFLVEKPIAEANLKLWTLPLYGPPQIIKRVRSLNND